VIPVLSHSDRHSDEELRYLRDEIDSAFSYMDIKVFDFTASHAVSREGDKANTVYAISSAPGDDDDVMDASLLMSSDYVRPLISSDLPRLMHDLFEPEHMQWLRHTAVKKYLLWRREQLSNTFDLQAQADLQQNFDTASRHHNRVASSGSPSTISTNSGALIPYSDISSPASLNHVQPQQSDTGSDFYRTARLEKWAQDLQASLFTDRRIKRLQLPTDEPCDNNALTRSHKPHHHASPPSRPVHFNPDDPLNLFSFSSTIRANLPLALRIVGIGSALGALALYAVRNWSSISSFFGTGQSQPETQPPTWCGGRLRDGFEEWKRGFASSVPGSTDVRECVVGEGFLGRGGDWRIADFFTEYTRDLPGFALMGPPLVDVDGGWGDVLRGYGMDGAWLRNFGWGDWGLGEGWGLGWS